jgi:hypothetical protein
MRDRARDPRLVLRDEPRPRRRPDLLKRLDPGTAGPVGFLIRLRPFRVGDRVRMHAGGVAGQVEGTVASLGLLYTTLANGDDNILVPNNVVLAGAFVPLHERAAIPRSTWRSS